MSELLSMLVPLHTLPGWPTAQDPKALQVLGLLIGFPALAFVIVIAVAKVGNMVKASRGESAVTDAVWVGGREPGDVATTTGSESSSGRGGAGARW